MKKIFEKMMSFLKKQTFKKFWLPVILSVAAVAAIVTAAVLLFGSGEDTLCDHQIVTDKAVEATCTEAGLTAGKHCSLCGQIFVMQRTVSALGHDTVSHAEKAATCEENGNKAYETCTRCDYTTYEKIDALGHDTVSHAEKAATCEENGNKAYETCTRCDYTTYEKIDALGHDTVSHAEKAATCEEDGNKAYETCTRCDYTTYEKIDALGHDTVSHAEKAATCEEDGNKAYETCTRCDYTTYEKIDALGHDTVSHAEKAATCEEDGNKAYETCTRCDYTTYEKIDAIGHTYTKQTVNASTKRSNADCENKATYWYSCVNCDDISSTLYFEYGTTASHNYAKEVVNAETKRSESDCTHKATYWYSCTGCDDISSTLYFEYGTTASHTYTKQTVNASTKRSNADCENRATYWYSCVNCDDISTTEYFEYGTTASHTYTKQTVNASTKRSNADCENKATYWYSCVNCDDISTTLYFEYGTTASHTYTKQTVNSSTKRSNADCENKATYWYSCVNCDDISTTEYFEYGTTASHTYTKQTVNSSTKRSNADCENKATYWYSCVNCDDISSTLYFEYGTTSSHTYTKQTVNSSTKRSNADCENKATYWYSCVDCDDISTTLYFEYGTTSSHTYTKQTVNASTKRSNADCENKATYWYSCVNCDDISSTLYFEYGTTSSHTYTKQTVNASTKRSNADCENKATYWYSCVNCDDISSTVYFEYGTTGSHNYVGGTCSVCGSPEETGDLYTRDGDYIYFGSYPQSEVTDSTLTSTLTSLSGTLPTSSNSYNWTSYEYYVGTGSEGSQSNATDYMWYQDVSYGGEKYRGVYFTSYRPYYTSYGSGAYQDDNGYSTSTVYWFKYDPIKWRILDEKNGSALILCEMLIDSQAYQNCYTYANSNYYATDNNGNILTDENGNKVYANNYAYSTIREWLNDDFYNTAFSSLQKQIIDLTTVDNSAASTTDANGNITQATSYACKNTEDYIFLLSEKEVTTSNYGFASYSTYDSMRQKQTTAYAQCQGAYTYSGGSYDGNGYWWLRSPYFYSSDIARVVCYDGFAYDYGSVNYTSSGVCPALWIDLGETYTRIDENENEDANGDYIYFGSYPQSEVTGTLATTLTSLSGTLPTSSNSYNWTSYEYYVGTGNTGSQSNATDYMWYQDVSYGGEKYRGVYFTSYRPYMSSYSSSSNNSEQYYNDYYTSTVYWFKYDPIKWRILDEQNGSALILCEMLIDSQAYQNCYTYTYTNGSYIYYATDNNGNILTDENGNKVYANNYAYSTIREWLNDDFYNTAFSSLQKQIIDLTTVDNSAASTTDTGNNITQATSYACKNTEDYIFLLSEKEVTTSNYGFASYGTFDSMRQKQTTAYAQCQGAYTYSGGSYDGNGWWWLRSPISKGSNGARAVGDDGSANGSIGVGGTNDGVCPALWISL